MKRNASAAALSVSSMIDDLGADEGYLFCNRCGTSVPNPHYKKREDNIDKVMKCENCGLDNLSCYRCSAEIPNPHYKSPPNWPEEYQAVWSAESGPIKQPAS